jgi:hypothetical protein
MSKTTTRTAYRSSITGRFVTKQTAIRHPKTTQKETNKVRTTQKPKKSK